MTSMLCNGCMYGSTEGFCGLGNVLITGTCSGYIEGQQPTTIRPLPWWDRAGPIDRSDHHRRPGCQVLPSSYRDVGYNYYAMFLDYEEDRQVVSILRLLESYRWVFNALRLCRWYTAYGKGYTYPLTGFPARVSVQLTPTWGTHKVMLYVRLVVTSMVPGNSSCQGDYNTEVPEQLWWLDPTLPRDMLEPMHRLLGSAVHLYDNQVHMRNKSMSPPGGYYINMDEATALLEQVLDMGLRLRGRALSEWNDAMDRLLGR